MDNNHEGFPCQHDGEFMQQPGCGYWQCVKCGARFSDAELAILFNTRKLETRVDELRRLMWHLKH